MTFSTRQLTTNSHFFVFFVFGFGDLTVHDIYPQDLKSTICTEISNTGSIKPGLPIFQEQWISPQSYITSLACPNSSLTLPPQPASLNAKEREI